MKTQNYHTQNGAIYYGFAHIASLALIDLIAEANKRPASQVTPRAGERSGDVVRLPAEINERTVLINLNEMDHIDSWRIAPLLEAMQRIKAHGGNLVFFGIRDDLRRFFERARLDQVFRIFSTREEALADQGRRPAAWTTLP